MASRTIRASQGDRVYVSGVLTETTGQPLDGDSYLVALAPIPSQITPVTVTPPLVTPDKLTALSPSSVRVSLLVGANAYTAPPGAYQLAVQLTDPMEVQTVLTSDIVTIR